MGLLLGKLLLSILWGTKDYGILMIGLNNAGKTTILYKLKMGELVTTIPTIGFNVESIKYQNGLIFVVDSNNKERISQARDELHKLLKNSELSKAKLMVFANKQDMAKVLSTKEVTDRLHLASLKQREWHVQSCSATTGNGLRERLDWLATALKDSPGKASDFQ